MSKDEGRIKVIYPKYVLSNIKKSNESYTGSLVSKRDNVNNIYMIFELKMRKIKVICMFIGNGHLTIDPWIWLKLTFLSSTASVLKDGRMLLEITSFYSKKITMMFWSK